MNFGTIQEPTFASCIRGRSLACSCHFHAQDSHAAQERRNSSCKFKSTEILNQNPISQNQRQPPLLIHQNIIPRSKIQALGTVIEKLEASVKTGIIIEDPQIFASLLVTCAQLKAIDLGIKVHNLIPLKLLSKNVENSSKLIRWYASNGYVEKAHRHV